MRKHQVIRPVVIMQVLMDIYDRLYSRGSASAAPASGCGAQGQKPGGAQKSPPG
jgi:hypothetical protein